MNSIGDFLTRYMDTNYFFGFSCKDDQTSADANEAGMNTGAMSYAFTSKLVQNNGSHLRESH